MENITIYNQRLAGRLMQDGFILIGMKPHNDGSGRNVFFFKDTIEIQKAIQRFTRKR